MAKIVKNPHERRADIIETAKKLFQTKEYERVTIQEIMNTLGIAKGTVYHYFSSKEKLLEAVVEDIINKNIEQMEMRVKKTKGNALKKLKALIETGNISSLYANILKGLHCPGNETLHTRLLSKTLIKQAPLYAQFIKQGCEEGIFKTNTPLESAEFILSATQFLLDRGFYPWQEEDLNRRIRSLPNLITQQLQAPEHSFDFLIALLKP